MVDLRLKTIFSSGWSKRRFVRIFACLAILAPDIVVYIYFIPMKITYALIFFALLDFCS